MKANGNGQTEVTEDGSELTISASDYSQLSAAVVFATDWTTETVVSQLRKGNILLNPRFQRRDAWDKARKSRFIESLILGLPIPQIVLAEDRDARGRYLVLDGKQRLLSLLHFWGLGEGAKKAFSLSGLEVRRNLTGKKYQDLEFDAHHSDDLRALQNQPIRTVVIRNWPNQDFLHLVFLRLNTGSVTLSPQELRQALFPGRFSNYVDDRAVQSESLKKLLKLKEPDYRMRDVELLARHLAFVNFIEEYSGRMKQFLDDTFNTINEEWQSREGEVKEQVDQFEEAVNALISIFSIDKVARKPGSKVLNKAIFDALVFYLRDPEIRRAAVANAPKVLESYDNLVQSDRELVSAVERDTASVQNTVLRLARFGDNLASAISVDFVRPRAMGQRIIFNGLWGRRP
jgi:hypothetical protein